MKKFYINNLTLNTFILSLPGIISIFISLFSIPVHLNVAGPENYGNYIIFHFILILTINLNFGIGKSTTISINNFPRYKKEISFQAIKYTFFISIIILKFFLLFYLCNKFEIYDVRRIYEFIYLLIIGSVITIFFVTYEGIFQGYQKFKKISIFNLFFFSLSVSIPSVLLLYNKNFSVNDLIYISILIKFLTTLIMFLIIKINEMTKKSKNRILLINLKENSKWITLNNILIQFYDLFDKYLIKIFLGPTAVAMYSIPQQLTGKLSIISKSFSAYLLPNLSLKKIDTKDFNLSLNIFIKIIPTCIFLIIPLYPLILKLWLGNSYDDNIKDLTKIFTLSVIFSCASHILITEFEASKSLSRNLKIEFILMPFFLLTLFNLINLQYSLVQISLLILLKEVLLLFARLYLLKSKIKNIKYFYFYSLYFILMLYFSFHNLNLYFTLQALLILNLLRR